MFRCRGHSTCQGAMSLSKVISRVYGRTPIRFFDEIEPVQLSVLLKIGDLLYLVLIISFDM